MAEARSAGVWREKKMPVSDVNTEACNIQEGLLPGRVVSEPSASPAVLKAYLETILTGPKDVDMKHTK